MRWRFRLLVACALGACLAVACTLNPQPIPPGAEERQDQDASSPSGGAASLGDSGRADDKDAGPTDLPDAGQANPPLEDGGFDGDATDGGDAGDDAPSDAPTDAPDDVEDAPSDGTTE